MAELNVFVRELEKELTCSICDDIFTEPKTLQCLHSFCFNCIAKWHETCRNQRQLLTCPTCRSREDLEDVSKIRSSFYLDSMLQLLHTMTSSASKQEQQELPNCISCEKRVKLVAFCPQCRGMICAECVNAHKTLKVFAEQHQPTMFADFKKKHVNSYIKNQLHCQEKFHEKNKLEYYCQTCLKCICQKCSQTAHTTHDKVSVEEKAEEISGLINGDLERVNQLKQKYMQDVELSKQELKQFENAINATKKKVHDEVQAQMKKLQDHETAMVKILDTIFLEEKTTKDQEQCQFNTCIKQLAEVQLQGQTLGEITHVIIQSYQKLQEICKTLLERPSIQTSQPAKHVHYITNPNVTQSLQDQLGKIVESVTDPSRCFIESLHDVRCGFINEFHVITRNSEGKVCSTNKDLIGVEIKDDDGNEVQNKVTEESQTGKYSVKYKAAKPSPNRILVSIGGDAIKNSPQTVTTLDVVAEFKPVKTFGEKGGGRGQFDMPLSLALSHSGEAAIVDRCNHRVVLFSVDGKYLREFGGEGTGDGELKYPWGVVFNEERILVTDHDSANNARLQEFDINGAYLKTIYRQKGVRLHGMCITDQNIAICFQSRDKEIQSGIKLFGKQSGHLIQEIPCIDVDEVPWNIAYGNGKYFVSYSNSNYIRCFHENGASLCTFVKKLELDGQFGPFGGLHGLHVYGADMIVVCDADNHSVYVFTQEGQFVSSFGSRGSGIGQMNGPVDVAIAPDGTVLVLELRGNRVQVWH